MQYCAKKYTNLKDKILVIFYFNYQSFRLISLQLKAKIIEQFGEPSNVEDIASAAGKPVASIWQYHYLNTDEKGEYYQTTELDFINDKVVMVVFMNNDGSEIPADAVKATPNKK